MKEKIIKKAESLIDIDREVVRAIVTSDFDSLPSLISDFRNLKIEMQIALNHLGVVEDVDDKAKEVLTRVQKPFPTDHVISQIEQRTTDGASISDLSDEELSEIGSEMFYSWISHYEYVRNIFKINTLVFRSSISPALRSYIGEVRNCFALDQHNA